MSESPNSAANSYKLHQVVDRQHNGIVAAAFEIPAHWQANSVIQWNYQAVSHPVTAWAIAYDPYTGDAFERFPDESYFWLNHQGSMWGNWAMQGFMQQGQNYSGQICYQPMPTADALAQLVIQKYRGKQPGLRYVGRRPEPHLLAELNLPIPPQTPLEGVSIRIEYQQDNLGVVEEEFYALRGQQEIPYQGPQGLTIQINWGLLMPHSFRAAHGRLDQIRPVFQRIRSSTKLNPAWQQLHAQILQQLAAGFNQQIAAGYQRIQAAGQLSHQISANNDAFLNMMEHQRQAQAHHQQPADTPGRSSADKFDDYIRGVETYDDPYWGESQHDYNYQYVWSDGGGNYRYSNDANFNPNIGDNLNWELMNPKK